MSNTVAILFKDYTPGAGRDASGNPKQGKVETRGKITVTNFARGGESLTPSDVGLTEIDTVDLRWEEEIGGPGNRLRVAAYSKSAQEFYCLEAGAGGEFDNIAQTRDPVITFRATGDSAAKGELL